MNLLLSGGNVFDRSGEILPDHGVLVEHGQITKVAPTKTFNGFQGEHFDLNGGTLMPGLVDCHVHLVSGAEADPRAVRHKMNDAQITLKALQNAQTTLRGGITSVRDCGGQKFLEFAVRDVIAKGIFLGPTIRAVGHMICMTGGHGNEMGRVADGPDEVIKAVREQIHAGCDQVKIMATGGVMTPGVDPEDAHYSAEEMAAGIAEGHRFRKKSASHAQGAQGILNAVLGGIDSIEHGIFMDDRCLEEMLARGTFLVPTIAALNHILENANNGIPDYVVEKSRRIGERHRQSIKMFYEAGGKIAMGTDAGTPFNTHGDNALELEYMVEIGFSNLDAIKAATVTASELLDIEKGGIIAEGSPADLLVVKGNPVEDITTVSRKENHLAVFKGGLKAT